MPFDNIGVITGPCHAEEVALEKLSYLTFSGIDEKATHEIAACFKTGYLNTVVVPVAVFLKNPASQKALQHSLY